LRVPLSDVASQIAQDELTYCKKVNNNCVTINKFDVLYSQNNCVPGQHINDCITDLSILKIHVYYPTNINYLTCSLPAIILFHGGAFNECGDYNDKGIREFGKKLAARGFVVFNVNYRVGVLADPSYVPSSLNEANPLLHYVCAQQMLAIYRALQDARGAIRSIIAMQNNNVLGTVQHPYKINVNNIFVGGISAGSLIALCAAYYGTQAKINDVFLDDGSHPISTSLGGIDPTDVYYANPPASGLPADDYFANLKGVINCWGSLFVPTANESNPLSFFAGQGYTLPPVVSFHGGLDTVFNYVSQGVYFSPTSLKYGSLFRTANRCLNATYKIPAQNQGGTIRSLICLGSLSIYNMLITSTPKIAAEVYIDCYMFHGLSDDCGECPGDPNNLSLDKNCTYCSYQTNFGTSAVNQDQTFDYIASRATTFLQAVMSNVAISLITTSFTRCENYRHTCNTANDNNGCNNEQTCGYR